LQAHSNSIYIMDDVILKKGTNDDGQVICLCQTFDKINGYFHFKWYITVDGEMLHQPSELRRSLHRFARMFNVEAP